MWVLKPRPQVNPFIDGVEQYNINNLGRAGHFSHGRTLVPLLHLTIIPGELGFRLDNAGPDFISAHFRTFYDHCPTQLVSTFARQFAYATLDRLHQFSQATACGVSTLSISQFRVSVKEWMEIHKNSSILITLVAHSAVSTGEIIYTVPGARKNRYASVDEVG
jgi:hypothetical protein